METMNLTHTAVLTEAFVLRLKPQGEGEMQILFPKLKLGANYFMSPIRCSPAQAGIFGGLSFPPQAEIFGGLSFLPQAGILPEFRVFDRHIH